MPGKIVRGLNKLFDDPKDATMKRHRHRATKEKGGLRSKSKPGRKGDVSRDRSVERWKAGKSALGLDRKRK